MASILPTPKRVTCLKTIPLIVKRFIDGWLVKQTTPELDGGIHIPGRHGQMIGTGIFGYAPSWVDAFNP